LIGESAGEGDNPFAPPKSGRDQARAAVEQEKQKKILDEIVKRSHVTIAENFQVKMPEQQAPQGLPPGFAPGQGQPGAAQQPVEPAKAPASKAGDSSKKGGTKQPK
jgi:hypothetical protein